MSVDLARWHDDESRPRPGQAWRDAALRVITPAVVLWGAIVGAGFLITGPLGGLKSENVINQDLQKTRTSTWDAFTAFWSHVGNTEVIIGVCIMVVVITWWVTREWWYAIVPAIAISTQAAVFVLASAIVGRSRPDATKLDPAPPTSSYPSGHVGASTALYLTIAFMAQRIETAWLRRLVTTACVIVPLLVAYARLYRGMHHLTDVLVGMVNGLVCALLAWYWLRRRSRRASAQVVGAGTASR